MNHDDLLQLLDLGGTAPAPPVEELIMTSSAQGVPPSASPTALALDDWGLRRGHDVLHDSARLQALDLGELAVADFFAAAFEPEPVLHEACADPQRHEFVRQLLETPAYRALHASTMLHEPAAAIAAAAFAEQFVQIRQDTDAQADPRDSEMSTLRAVGQAAEEVGELRQATEALGLGPGSPGSNDAKAIAALFQRVRAQPVLRRICEQAGRFRRVAQSRQRLKTTHGLDDLVGVVPGGELGRLLPHELARLAVPELELDTLRRLVERQCLCREYQAVEPVGKGPVIIVLDESGSMLGDKIETAKALALALAWIARRQRRWCALVAYSGYSGERLLPLPPGRWDETRLLDWLLAFIGGGSSLDLPIDEMPDIYRRLEAPLGRTDVIFVTDARLRIPEASQERFRDWKRSVGARVTALVIGSAADDLALVCDECHTVAALRASDDAVGRVLSL